MGRTLTSAWIETCGVIWKWLNGVVALSRVRGLKRQVFIGLFARFARRTLTSAWIETILKNQLTLAYYCRTLTSAWIETV